MEEFILLFVKWPSVLVSAFFGALFVTIGSLIGLLVFRGRQKSWVTAIPTIIGFIVGFQLAQYISQRVEVYKSVQVALPEMKKVKLFALIISDNPGSSQRLDTILENSALRDGSRDGVFRAAREFVRPYLEDYTLNSPPGPIYRMLQQHAQVIGELVSQPEACVKYYLGAPTDPATLEKEAQMKVEVVEAAIKTRDKLQRPAGNSEIFSSLADIYRQKSFEVGNIQRIPDVYSLPPSEGCAVANQYMQSLTSLGQDRGAFIFKSILSNGTFDPNAAR